MSAGTKTPAEAWGALPARAMRDDRLSALELRVLLAVASHDGRSSIAGRGKGCIAKRATIAHLAGAHPTSVSKALSALVELRYLERVKDGRKAIFRVVYHPVDLQVKTGLIFDRDPDSGDQLDITASDIGPDNWPDEIRGRRHHLSTRNRWPTPPPIKVADATTNSARIGGRRHHTIKRTSSIDPREKSDREPERPHLPDWMPLDSWRAYCEMMAAMDRPLVGDAEKAAVRILDTLRQRGHPPQSVIDQSVRQLCPYLYELQATR